MRKSKDYYLQIGCSKTNSKTLVTEYEDYITLKSYDTYICIFDRDTETLINNIEYYRYSQTTKKHYKTFKNLINYELGLNIKNILYLDSSRFTTLHNKVVVEYLDMLRHGKSEVNLSEYLTNIYNEYDTEKRLINRINNYVFSLDKDYTKKIGSFKVLDVERVELKTRVKEVYYCELPNSISDVHFKVTLTTNRNRSKLLDSCVEVDSKCGLSFDNYTNKDYNSWLSIYSKGFKCIV